MVKQMRGQYKVKSEDLKPLFERARKMSQSLESFRIEHVYREQNREADELWSIRPWTKPRVEAPPPRQPRKSRPRKKPRMRFLARCKNGELQLDEPLNLPDGTEVEVVLR